MPVSLAPHKHGFAHNPCWPLSLAYLVRSNSRFLKPKCFWNVCIFGCVSRFPPTVSSFLGESETPKSMIRFV